MVYNYEANKSSSTFILAALVLLFISNAPLGHGEALGVAVNSTQIIISGKLYCTSTGNPQPGAPAAAGVLVSATCKGTNGALTADTAITNEAGGFAINLNATLIGTITLVPSDSPCTVTVAIPVTGTNCTALPLNGVLASVPRLLSVVLTSIGAVVVELRAVVFALVL